MEGGGARTIHKRRRNCHVWIGVGGGDEVRRGMWEQRRRWEQDGGNGHGYTRGRNRQDGEVEVLSILGGSAGEQGQKKK